MGNKQSIEPECDSYLLEEIEDYVYDESPYNFRVKFYPILHPTKEVLLESIRLETEILKFSGLELNKEIWFEDIKIDFFGANHLHCIRAQENKNFLDKKKPTMIMIHGYNSTCTHYIKMLKNFYEDYNVYAIDMIGMGFSSRPQPKLEDSKDYINFFVDSLEAFRLKIFEDYKQGDNFSFYLIGHSLGGYISTNYAIKYPKYIKKLFLLSPVGITDVKNNTEKDLDERTSGMKRKMIDSVTSMLWPLKTTPQDMCNSFFFGNMVKEKLANNYLVSEEERLIWNQQNYLKLSSFPRDLDCCIYYFLKTPLPMAVWPLENVIKKRVKNFSIDFIYGTNDWMETKGAKRLCENDSSSIFSILYINGGRHKLNLESPDEVSRLILYRIHRDKIINLDLKVKDSNITNETDNNNEKIIFEINNEENIICEKENYDNEIEEKKENENFKKDLVLG